MARLIFLLVVAAATKSINAQSTPQPLCVEPASTTGYDLSSATKSLFVSGFSITGITCASGYSGVPVATVCGGHGQAYTLSGCSDGGKPGQVDGGKIYFSNVKDSSFTINWKAPDLGDYAAQILGYKIEIAEVCANTDYDDLDVAVGGSTYNMHTYTAGTDVNTVTSTRTISDTSRTTALALGSSSIGNDGTTTATYAGTSQDPFVGPRTWTMNYAQASGAPDYRPNTATPSAAIPGTATFESMAADNSASPIFTATYPAANSDASIDLKMGTVLDQASCSASKVWVAGEPVAAGSVGAATSTYTDLMGVYTPMGGQDHSKQCRDECAQVASGATTCADIAADNSIRDALFTSAQVTAGVTDEEEIIEACGGCYPDAVTATGCFPGSAGFPAGPHYSCASRDASTGLCDCAGGACVARHTVSGLAPPSPGGDPKYYVVKVTAHNHFGDGPASTASYAVKMLTAPTAPLSVTSALNGVTAIDLGFKAPDNFDTGTNDCATGGHTEADAVAPTAAKLACAMNSVTDILAECDGEKTVGVIDPATVDGVMSAAEAAACFGASKKYDCTTTGSGNDLTPVSYACTTVGTGAGVDITKYTIYQTDSSGSVIATIGTLDPATTSATAGVYPFAVTTVGTAKTTPVAGTTYYFAVSASRPSTATVGGFLEGPKSAVTSITMPDVPTQPRGLGPKLTSITLPGSSAAQLTTTLPVFFTGTAATGSTCTISLDFAKAKASAVSASAVTGYDILAQSCSKSSPLSTGACV